MSAASSNVPPAAPSIAAPASPLAAARAALFAALLAAAAPAFAIQVEIGAPQVDSAPGQLLDAEFPLRVPNPALLRDLRVRIADAAGYAEAGATPPAFLNALLVELVAGGDAPHIAVSSIAPIAATRFELVLELRLGEARSLRRRAVAVRPAAPQAKPAAQALSAPEALAWLIGRLAAGRGVDRVDALAELRRLAGGAPGGPRARGLILRADLRAPPEVATALAAAAGMPAANFDARRLLMDAEALARLLDAGATAPAAGRNDTLDSRLGRMRGQVAALENALLEQRRLLARAGEEEEPLPASPIALGWLLEARWWFAAGGLFALLAAAAFVRYLRARK